jgi:hypothetical protein
VILEYVFVAVSHNPFVIGMKMWIHENDIGLLYYYHYNDFLV